jgi:hypothetical protein
VVYEAKTHTEFAENIKEALAKDNDEFVAARRKKVEKASWDGKARLLMDELLGKAESARRSKAGE